MKLIKILIKKMDVLINGKQAKLIQQQYANNKIECFAKAKTSDFETPHIEFNPDGSASAHMDLPNCTSIYRPFNGRIGSVTITSGNYPIPTSDPLMAVPLYPFSGTYAIVQAGSLTSIFVDTTVCLAYTQGNFDSQTRLKKYPVSGNA